MDAIEDKEKEDALEDVVRYFEPYCACTTPRTYNFINGRRACVNCGRFYADD